MIYKNISSKAIIRKVMRDLNPNNAEFIDDAVEWIGEALQHIGAAAQLEDKHCIIDIKDHKACLPTNLAYIQQVAINGDVTGQIKKQREELIEEMLELRSQVTEFNNSIDTIAAVETGQSVTTPLTIDNPLSFSGEFLGFNPGWTWNSASPTLDQTLDYAMGILRFPAGTLGNYYHYNDPGYGLDAAEMAIVGDSIPITNHTGANYIIDFADYCILKGITKVHYMAGLYFQKGAAVVTYQEHLDAVQYLEGRGLEVVGIQVQNEVNFDKYAVLYPSDWISFKADFLQFVADISTIGTYKIGVQIPNIQNRTAARAASYYSFVTTDPDILNNIDFYSMHLYPTDAQMDSSEEDFIADVANIQSLKPIRFTEFNVNGSQGGYTYRGLQHAKDLWRLYLVLLDAGPEMLFVHNLYGTNVNAFYQHGVGTSTMAELWKEITFLIGSTYEVVTYDGRRALRALGSNKRLYTVFYNNSGSTIRVPLQGTSNSVKVLNATGFDVTQESDFVDVSAGDLVVIDSGFTATVSSTTVTPGVDEYNEQYKTNLYALRDIQSRIAVLEGMYFSSQHYGRGLRPLAYASSTFHASMHCEDCVNECAVHKEDYLIDNGYIKTSFEEGQVCLSYKAYPIDEDCYPLVPDDISYKEALFWYVYKQMLLGGFDKPNNRIDYAFADEKWRFYCTQARNSAVMPDMDKYQAFMDQWVRLIPDINRHAAFFDDLSEREQLYRGDY